jgi:hypothetical protein
MHELLKMASMHYRCGWIRRDSEPMLSNALTVLLLALSSAWTTDSFRAPGVAVRPAHCRLRPTLRFESANGDPELEPEQSVKEEMPAVPAVPTVVEGYLSSDFASIGDGKQLRVGLYIALALVPVLFLVPFFLSRDFVPPLDPEAMMP